MLSTSARLLRLLSLLQLRRHWSGEALAGELGVEGRTLRRDIERLRTLGYPVQAASGVGGGYQLGAATDAGGRLPPVQLEEDEAVTVAVALRAATASIVGLEDAALRLLAKLDALLPPALRARAGALHGRMLSLSPNGAPRSDADVLLRVASACRDHAVLQFRYRRHDGADGLREVEPVQLANYGRRWYLVAWDRERDDWRTFRVDRIREALTTGKRYTPKSPPERLGVELLQTLSQVPYRHTLRVQLNGDASELARELPEWIGSFEPLDEGRCLLTTGGETPEALIAQLVMLGMPFELAPNDESQRAALQAVLQRLQDSLVPKRRRRAQRR